MKKSKIKHKSNRPKSIDECTVKWTPVGVGDFNAPSNNSLKTSLGDDIKKQILLSLHSAGIKPEKQIFDRLDEAVLVYALGQQHHDATKPSAIRQNLSEVLLKSSIDLSLPKDELIKSMTVLLTSINDLDMGARQLIPNNGVLSLYKHINVILSYINHDEINKRAIKVRLNKCIKIVKLAYESAGNYADKGRLLSHHKLTFAAETAFQLKSFGYIPTCKRGDLFEQLLIIMLSHIHNKDFLDLHTLAEDALSKGCPIIRHF